MVGFLSILSLASVLERAPDAIPTAFRTRWHFPGACWSTASST